ncbi:hypothetical protein H5410_033622 [Solanum commersonii]|uniref:Uncharacterized protein n=1 Tax=Solanum commersonii TaxID=4109 RepID=A0A9J5YT45_SOLCO|nr:hypothetical protein H5410_033622 [Solanum commersonii]
MEARIWCIVKSFINNNKANMVVSKWCTPKEKTYSILFSPKDTQSSIHRDIQQYRDKYKLIKQPLEEQGCGKLLCTKRLLVATSQKQHECSTVEDVAQRLAPGNDDWNLNFRRNLNDWEMGRLAKLLLILENFQGLSQCQNRIIWKTECRGRLQDLGLGNRSGKLMLHIR